MSFKRITTIERTLYVSKCPTCGDSVERDSNPPRERFCNTCQIWVPFEKISYTGPDLEHRG